jgi:hypothetical protein
MSLKVTSVPYFSIRSLNCFKMVVVQTCEIGAKIGIGQ